ncbi:MAG TPA: SpoIIE family protein phosphatase [Terracidiphilus sp.]|nr:SpoIIE family protein phosphatase [Terracidiphilus sp.]
MSVAALHVTVPAFANTPIHFDGGAATLNGPWQFHLGDNPAWASPAFDDDAWEQLTADEPWGMQGHANRDGFAWYRYHIVLAHGQSPDQLAILIPAVEDAYELYWNGHLVGSHGKLPPHPIWYVESTHRSFGLGPAQSGVLALRVWKAPFLSFDDDLSGGFYAPPLIGSPQSIAGALAELDYHWLRSYQFTFALIYLNILVAILGFGLWYRERFQWLAFWMACFSASLSLTVVLLNFKIPLPSLVAQGLDQPVEALGDFSLWFILLYLLDLNKDARILRLTRFLAGILFAIAILESFVTMGFSQPHPLPWQIADMALTALSLPLVLYPYYLIGTAILRRGLRDPTRWVVAVFVFLSRTLWGTASALMQGRRFTHITLGPKLLEPLFVVLGVPINAQRIFVTGLLVTLVYAVYRYSSEARLKQIRLEEEIRNARAVQQVLIPSSLPFIRDFKVESVYKPAEEVGGDFFQIIPLPAGGVLIVIGDVSGKGIPAAMTVSLLVGTVRTLAHYTESPAQILTAMNQRMLARTRSGFTTCLILRADTDGSLTLANAGHLAPYLGSQELTLANGLPLGLSATASYSESTRHFGENEQLTLLTDGVVEARSKTGELFGFERTLAISTHSAESIAEAAQRFGQQDDITVLTIARKKAAIEPEAGVSAQALSPSAA